MKSETVKCQNAERISIFSLAFVYVLPWLASVAVAFFWPAQSDPFGIDFTRTKIAQAIPSIHSYIEKSSFPKASGAYFVLSGILSIPYLVLGVFCPLTVFFSRKLMRRYYVEFSKRQTASFLAASTSVLWAPLIMLVQPGCQFAIAPVSDERWALALFGPFFSFFVQRMYPCLALGGRCIFLG